MVPRWRALSVVIRSRNLHLLRVELRQFGPVEAHSVSDHGHQLLQSRLSFASLIRRCGAAKALAQGKRLHESISRTVYSDDIFLQNLLVQMYGKCGSISEAQGVFERICDKNTFSWNIMIAAYAQNGHLQEAIAAFREMPLPDVVSWNTIISAYIQNGKRDQAYQVLPLMDLEGFAVENVTLITLIDLCASTEDLQQGRFIHSVSIDSQLETDQIVGGALINMYGKCESMQEAIQVFEKMPRRNVIMWTAMVAGFAQNGHMQEAILLFAEMPARNVVSWNAMIAAYARNGYPREAIDLFFEMEQAGVPKDQITFVTAIDACASISARSEGEIIHSGICSSYGGLISDSTVRAALVNMYSKCGCFDSAKEVFDLSSPSEETNRNLWTAMIAANARTGHLQEASIMLQKIQSRLETTHKNILITAFAENGHLEQSEALFQTMNRDNVSWNSLIAAYGENGHCKRALLLFRQMDLEGMSLTTYTFVHALNACARLESLPDCEILQAELQTCKSVHSNTVVRTAFLNMLARCGKLEQAKMVFDSMPRRNMVSWNAMIAAYAQKGQYKRALETFSNMDLEGVEPNKVTFVGILHACADIGAIREGKEILSSIDLELCKSEPVLGTAVVNMYSKCGMVEKAKLVFDNTVNRDAVSWSAMIAAYTRNSQPQQALYLFHLMILEGVHPTETIFVLVISASSHAGFLHTGLEHFTSISESYLMAPTIDHYGCLLDLLGRAGKLREAEELLTWMPFEPRLVEWTTLLSAACMHGDLRCGSLAAGYATMLDAGNAENYVMLYNMYKA